MEIYLVVLLIIIIAEVSYLIIDSRNKLSKMISERLIIIDTSVLIDGRIISVVKSGFIQDKLIIPRCVISELQYMADQADSEKRARARYGLDMVLELQNIKNIKVEILQDDAFSEFEVDDQLLKLSKKYNASICTIDYNLNKVAVVENIPVLNINDLAMSLRMAYLPGEKIIIELTDKGQESHQAVGHLHDGTMVVVENAKALIGKSVEVEFIRCLQTAAGKMMFAKIAANQSRQKEIASSNMPIKKQSYQKQNINRRKFDKPHGTQQNAKVRQSKPSRQSNEQSFINLVNKQ